MMFSKLLQSLPLPAAGRTIKALGFEGVDLTVRSGGHVEPSRVRAALPEAARVLRDLGLELPHLTTAITSAADPDAGPVFEAAAALGIREVKLGYWTWDGVADREAGLDDMARDLEGLEALARRAGVRANVHTHAGGYRSARAADVARVIAARNPVAIGAYPDPGHLAVEEGPAGCLAGLALLRGRIAVVALKDFTWEEAGGPSTGLRASRRSAKVAPVGSGIVPWRDVFAALGAGGFAGWASVHSEYQGSHSWRDLTVPELIEQTRADVAVLRGLACD
ncbi:MAG: TIM barrel protein [bacterium]